MFSRPAGHEHATKPDKIRTKMFGLLGGHIPALYL